MSSSHKNMGRYFFLFRKINCFVFHTILQLSVTRITENSYFIHFTLKLVQLTGLYMTKNIFIKFYKTHYPEELRIWVKIWVK